MGKIKDHSLPVMEKERREVEGLMKKKVFRRPPVGDSPFTMTAFCPNPV
jgi:hypothetical protein